MNFAGGISNILDMILDVNVFDIFEYLINVILERSNAI